MQAQMAAVSRWETPDDLTEIQPEARELYDRLMKLSPMPFSGEDFKRLLMMPGNSLHPQTNAIFRKSEFEFLKMLERKFYNSIMGK